MVGSGVEVIATMLDGNNNDDDDGGGGELAY